MDNRISPDPDLPLASQDTDRSARSLSTAPGTARAWGEHVESEANIADEPSMKGSLASLREKRYAVRETALSEFDYSEGAQLSILVSAVEPHTGAEFETDAASALLHLNKIMSSWRRKKCAKLSCAYSAPLP